MSGDRQDMCRSREEILEDHKELRQYRDEIELLRKRLDKGGNGETKLELYKHRTVLDARIDNIMNQDDIQTMLNKFKKLDRDRVKHPSIIKQFYDIPKMAIPLSLATLMFFWLVISNTTPKDMLEYINLTGWVSIEYEGLINAATLMIMFSLLFYSLNEYKEYVKSELEEREGDSRDYKSSD